MTEPRTTLASLRAAIEFAPAGPGPVAPDLRGWWTPDDLFLCAVCAGRIFARGCRLPEGSAPAWKGERDGECCLCYALPDSVTLQGVAGELESEGVEREA